MRRILFTAAVLALTTVVWPGSALAVPFNAQISDVADAFDPDNPFDFNASVGFRRIVKRSRITREATKDGQYVVADVLDATQVSQILDIKAAVGLFRDLELTFFLPYTLTLDSDWQHHPGIDDSTSLVLNDPSLGGPLFGLPYKTYQSGLTTLDLGVAFSPWNDQRDDTKPTLTLRIVYGIPIGAAYKPVRSNDPAEDAVLADDPANGRDQNNRAPAGDKIHRLRFELAASKRFGPAEPYFALNYTQPWADRSAAEGLVPQNTGGFVTGVELIPWDSPKDRQRLSFDFRFGVQYWGPGRTYSELTGPLRQLTQVDNYSTISVGGNLVFQPIEFVRLTSGISFGYDTNHWITNESPGNPDANGVVDLTDPSQLNPHYRDAIDAVGRRFKAEDTTIFTWYVALALML